MVEGSGVRAENELSVVIAGGYGRRVGCCMVMVRRARGGTAVQAHGGGFVVTPGVGLAPAR